MILFNEQLVAYFKLSGTFIWQTDDESSYRFFFFYFGLSFIGAGSLIFQMRCPYTIKLHPTLDQYIERERNILSLTRMGSLFWLINRDLEILIPNPGTASSFLMKQADEFIKDHNVNEYLDDPVQRPKFENEALKLHWLLSNHTSRNTRLFIASTYALGFLQLSIPTLDTFARVCIAFYVKLFT